MHSGKPGLRAKVLGSLLIKAANSLIGFGVAILLARSLGVDGYGAYSFAFAIASVLAVPGQVGMPQLVVRETASALVARDFGLVKGVWVWAMLASGAVSLVLGLIAYFVVAGLGDLGTNEARSALLWALCLVPILSLGVIRGAALRGLGHVFLGQLPEFVLRPFFLLCLVALVPALVGTGLTASMAMALHVAAATLAFLIGGWLLLQHRPPEMRSAEIGHRTRTRAWSVSALPLALVGGLHLLNNQSGLILVGVLDSGRSVGIYRAAVQMSLLVGLPLQAINMVIAPRLAGLYRSGNKVELQRIVRSGARLALLLSLPGAIALVIWGPWIIGSVFGRDFAASFAPMAILLVGQLASAAAGSVALLLNMTGNEAATAKAVGASVAVNLILTSLLVPSIGAVGAALGAALALGIWNLVLIRTARVKLDISSHAFGPQVH